MPFLAPTHSISNLGVIRWVLLCCCSLLLSSGYPADDATTEAVPVDPGLTYEVKVEGADSSLAAYLLEVSDAHARRERKPTNVSVLKRRVEADLPTLRDALRARGYYDAQINKRIEEKDKSWVVTFAIEPGPQYRFSQCRVENLDPESNYPSPSSPELGLVIGELAEAALVLAAEDKLLTGAKEAGYVLAKADERSVSVDHDSRTMEVILRFHPGPAARLGDVKFKGAPGVKTTFLTTLVPWKFDTPYQPQLVEDMRQALVDSDLFTTIQVRPGDSLNLKGQLPINVELVERFHRTFKANLGYNITKGPEISLGWWHRNYFGAGERLSFEGTLSALGYSVDTKYRQPSFYRPDQALVMDAHLTSANTDAYDTLTAGISAGVERRLSKNRTITVGSTFRISRVDDLNTSIADNFGLLSLPLKFDGDFSNNRLDATRGWRFLLQATPYMEIINTHLYFGKLLGKYSHYFELLDHQQLVLAGRAVLGGIFGATHDAIPADERFHAGGGGSIRGYGYQMAGPLNADGKPMGGTSLLELSGEARIGITENFRGVFFIDGGGTFAQQVASAETFLIGAGVGIRYATPIGPIRFDIGVPVKKRDNFDDPFQIYLSIGQAF